MSIKEAPHVGGGVCSPGKAMHLSLEAEAGHGDARRCPGTTETRCRGTGSRGSGPHRDPRAEPGREPRALDSGSLS